MTKNFVAHRLVIDYSLIIGNNQWLVNWMPTDYLLITHWFHGCHWCHRLVVSGHVSLEWAFKKAFKKKVISKVFAYKLVIDQVNVCRQCIHDFLLVSFDFYKLITLFHFSPAGKKRAYQKSSFVCFWENKGIMLQTLRGKQKYQVTNVGVEKRNYRLC